MGVKNFYSFLFFLFFSFFIPFVSGYNPIGYLDSATPSTISGWACDQDAPLQSINVHIYFDGPAGVGYGVDIGPTNVSSESLVNTWCGGGTAHRFSYTIPQNLINAALPGAHSVYAYGINAGAGSNALLSQSPKYFVTGASYVVAHLTDTHIPQYGLDNIRTIVQKINQHSVNKTIITGDISRDSPDYYTAKAELDNLTAGYFPIPGNHDITHTYSSYPNDPSYGFRVAFGLSSLPYIVSVNNEYQFVFLSCTKDYWVFPKDTAHCSDAELNTLQTALSNGKQTFVFVHYPILQVSGHEAPLYPKENLNSFYNILNVSNLVVLVVGHDGCEKGIYTVKNNVRQYMGPHLMCKGWCGSCTDSSPSPSESIPSISYLNIFSNKVVITQECATNSCSDAAPIEIPLSVASCTSFAYSAWSPSTCPSSGTQTRTEISRTPAGCAGTPILSQTCTYIPLCTSTNWNYSDGACQSNNKLTRTWTKTGTCSGGETHPDTQLIDCTYIPPTCASFTYTDWSPTVCPSNGIQTRTVATQTPSGCAGGNPILSQNCTYVPPTCTSFTYTDWSPVICPSSEIQTRTVATQTPSGCTGGSPVLSQSCNYIPACTEDNWIFSLSPSICPSSAQQTKTWEKIGTCTNGVSHPSSETISCDPLISTCTSFTYSNWSPTICPSNGIQTRVVATQSPTGCIGGNPVTTQDCNYFPTCTESHWINTDGECQSNNTKVRTWEKIGSCTGGVTHSTTETITCTYTTTCTSFTYSAWAPAICPSEGIQTRTVATQTPTGCTEGNPVLSQSCTYTPTCTESHWDYTLEPAICPTNKTQTKKYYKITNCINGITKTDENISCDYNSPQCQYTYTKYGECINEIQKRIATVINKPCQGQPINLAKTCTVTKTCTDSHWSYTLGDCLNGLQLKKWKKISDCNSGIQHIDENISCAKIKCTTGLYSEWSTCDSNNKQTKTLLSVSPAGCINELKEKITRDCMLDCKGIICDNTCYTKEGVCCNNKWNKNISSCDYELTSIGDKVIESNDEEAVVLLRQAKTSLENGEIAKGKAEAQTALLKTALNQNPSPELTEAFEQAKLALQEKDYQTAEQLSITALDNTQKNNSFDLLEPTNQLIILAIIIVIVSILLILAGKEKPNKEDSQKQKQKEKILKELKEKLKK